MKKLIFLLIANLGLAQSLTPQFGTIAQDTFIF